MKATAHIGISAVAAVSAYKMTGSPSLSISLFLSGIFIDLDHLADYILLSREQFSLSRFFSWYEENRWQKVFLVFHSLELLTILIIAAFLLKNDIVTGIAIGCTLHLVSDQVGLMTRKLGKRVSPWFYFFTYRYAVGFEKSRFLVKK